MKVVIIGGVAGGMSCAARLRRRNEHAEVVVLEKGQYVSFANCGLPYYVGGEIEQQESLLLHTPESLSTILNIDVRVNSEVVGVDSHEHTVTVRSEGKTYTESYDKLVLSPGAEAIMPPISGIDSLRVSTLRTVDDAVRVAEAAASASSAVVLGAGFIGLEAAEAFAQRGLSTAIVEMADHVLPPLEPEMAHTVERHLSRDLGIAVHTGQAATAITETSVQLADGTEIPADIIVVSTGVRPNTEVFIDAGIDHNRGAMIIDEHGRTSVDDIYAVGDATQYPHAVTGASRMIALAGPANRAGRLVADHIVEPDTARSLASLASTAIVRVGELTAATTGANRRDLAAAGERWETINLHPLNHAGYFPGASPMELVVHFNPETGRLYGAQAVGRNGVDKRIDVLATAIKAGMKAEDLIDLDLAYAPPYGSAKDPVNFAGMVAENVRNGVLTLWHAETIPSDGLILDVRSREEFAHGHLKGAYNIPHTEIRERLDELREKCATLGEDNPTVYTMCAAGVRSWLATCILRGEGFDVAMLSGGMKTIESTYGSAVEDILER